MDYGDLSETSHALLYQLRNRPENNTPEAQRRLAPMEHRAFAREWATESPITAAASLTAAIPVYTMLKMAGLLRTRSPASLDEMAEGYRGLGEGLKQSGATDAAARVIRRLYGAE